MTQPSRRFYNRPHKRRAPVAQGIEQGFPKPCVGGSNPSRRAPKIARFAGKNANQAFCFFKLRPLLPLPVPQRRFRRNRRTVRRTFALPPAACATRRASRSKLTGETTPTTGQIETRRPGTGGSRICYKFVAYAYFADESRCGAHGEGGGSWPRRGR